MPRYQYPRIVNFKKKGIIEIMYYPEFQEKYDSLYPEKNKINMPKNKIEELKHILTFIYFTGARPIELINIKTKHFKKDKKNVLVYISTAKNGLPRFFPLPLKYIEIRILYDWVIKKSKDDYTFNSLRKTKYPKDYIKYHLNIPGYFFRHNRFSLLSENGASAQQIKQLKGARSMRSVDTYLHLSKREAEKAAEYV